MLLGDLARILGGELSGNTGIDITGASGLEDAHEGDVSFVASAGKMKLAASSVASCLLVSEFDDALPQAQIKVADPHHAFVTVLETLCPRRRPAPGVHASAHLADSASIGPDVSIGAGVVLEDGARIGSGSIIYAGAYIGFDVEVGDGCIIYPGVTLMDGVSMGNRVIIHAGTVIGSDGFGFIQRDGRHVKVPQVGTVVIEDDVEIGACCCIDRATTGATIIRKGVKLDNLVQIGHNVEVGEHAALASQFGVAGSSRIGSWVMAGGQAGVADHMNIAEKGTYAGHPARPVNDWLKISAALAKLPGLIKRVRALEKKIDPSKGGE